MIAMKNSVLDLELGIGTLSCGLFVNLKKSSHCLLVHVYVLNITFARICICESRYCDYSLLFHELDVDE